MHKRPVSRVFLSLLLLPAEVFAHSFGKVYTLPMPLHVYLAGVSFALLLSTLAAVWMYRVDHTTCRNMNAADQRTKPLKQHSWIWVSTFLLMMCMLTSAIGNRNPFLNISMNLFWIDFLLLFFYINFFVNKFSVINPWQAIVFFIFEKFQKFLPEPAPQASAPLHPLTLPILCMVALFSIELLTHANPRALAVFLLLYLLISIYGASRIGPVRWFKDYDFFNLFFAVFTIARLKDRRALRPLETCIVFFVLATTTFDGIKESLLWLSIYWGGFYQSVLNGMLGLQYSADFKLLQAVFTTFEAFTLIVIAPIVYVLLFAFFSIATAQILSVKNQLPQLFFSAARSVIPIVVTYHAAHYLSLLGEQAFQLPFMLVDPFGWGWLPEISNLRLTMAWTFDPEWVWYAQVLLILAGHAWGGIMIHHAIGTYSSTSNRLLVAHSGALLLMVSLTTIGLWVLSLPINPNS